MKPTDKYETLDIHCGSKTACIVMRTVYHILQTSKAVVLHVQHSDSLGKTSLQDTDGALVVTGKIRRQASLSLLRWSNDGCWE